MTTTTITEATFVALPLRDELAPWFGGYEADYDMDAIYDEYEAALEVELDGRPGFAGFSWPAASSPTLWVYNFATPEQVDAIRDALYAAHNPDIDVDGGVDLASIAHRHELRMGA